MKRDLKADLELCDKTTSEVWDNFSDASCEYGVYVAGYDSEYSIHPQELAATCEKVENANFIAQAREGWPHAIERALEAEAKLEKAKDLIQRWFDGEIGAFGVMDALIIDLEFDIDGIPDEALEYHNIKRKEVLVDEA